ncbi:MAG: S8 family serine peptidase, partial [Cyanobacteria bacterium J06636_27]
DIEITIPTASDQQVQDFEQQKISLRSGDLLPRENLQEEFLEELNETSSEGLHGIISFTRTPLAGELQQLEEAGIFRQSILSNDNVYGLVEKGVNLSDPNIDELIEFITPLEPEDKIAPDILVGNYQKYFVDEIDENYVLNDDGSLSLSVLFAEDTPLEEIRSILEQEAISFSFIFGNTWLVDIREENVGKLATYDQVEWINPRPVPTLPLNSNTRPFVKVDDVQAAQVDDNGNLILSDNGSPNYNGLTGEGITVVVHDTGIDASHPDFTNKVLPGGTPDTDGHGTHVAGTIAGTGFQSDKNDSSGTPNGGRPFQWRGVAPNASLIASDFSDSDNNDNTDDIGLQNLLDVFSDIETNSLDLSNHSHILGRQGEYEQENTYDALVRGSNANGIPFRRPQIFAAGNSGARPSNGAQLQGYFSLLNQLKNAVVVGNWDATNNLLSNGSSLGPAHDGRIKPDVVAPGTNIKSTATNSQKYNSTSEGYFVLSGTSMASPAVAGIHALL